MILADIAEYVTDKISSNDVSLNNYVTTDSLLQNKRGRECAQNLPPMPCALIHFQPKDILIANIRPYLKKIWFADIEGGCSSDVLVFRAKEGHFPNFLYATLMQDAFYDYVMKGVKGSKMPRGDKEQIMRYKMPTFSSDEEQNIGKIVVDIEKKLQLSRAINDNLEKMAKQLYDYWFVQFDFPNENGRPYKSSGGAMVWNEKLKREIPKEWDNCTLEYYLIIKNGRDHKHLGNGIYPVYGSGGEIRKVDSFIYSGESILMPRKGSLNNIMYVNDAFWSVDTMFYSEMKQPHCVKYVFYSIKDIDFTRWDSGTGVPSMTSSTLYSILLVKPDADSLAKFDEIITPLFLMIKKNEMQIVELTKQRDDLLPLLMNGQASVNYHLSDD
ncbi:restriction endonuclease subunit S [Parabacteroides distasonis]|uniref:restriction endonuclease subunit S n=1 Tax=Parabacteroides distasonis TaxID=823 RepID=UPI00325BF620